MERLCFRSLAFRSGRQGVDAEGFLRIIFFRKKKQYARASNPRILNSNATRTTN